jgi:5-hydroxyisourate hydrolase
MITTHVLDTARGAPATGLSVVLDTRRGNDWVRLSSGTTDERGRISSLTEKLTIVPGLYRLTFDTGAYERDRGVTPFFPEVQVTFSIKDPSEHFHVPLVMSPFGYSTYRGI